MKKIVLSMVLLVTTMISGYFVFIWEPESVTVESDASIEVNKDQINKESEKSNDDKEKNNSERKNILVNFDKSINDSILESDKDKLNLYINKLSVLDTALVEQYMNSKEGYNDIKELIRIFKNRFSEEEYREIKEVLKKYLDVDKIEKDI